MQRRLLVCLLGIAGAAFAAVGLGSGAALGPADLTPVPTANAKAPG